MKKFLFITGTRADYGKMKSLMLALEANDDYEVFVFVCGMHLLEKYGSTYNEVLKDGYNNVYVASGLCQSQDASENLGNTIGALSKYVTEIGPDVIVVHGDRIDALAGAAVGALRNIRVCHIEGGELSGTVDESIRHAITKLAHVHFVSNEDAKQRLIQLGEEEQRIFVIGSPDIDIMISEKLPSLEKAKSRYDIPFDNYGILMYHPVTTEVESLKDQVKAVVSAVKKSKKQFIVIYPNNDLGSDIIIQCYENELRGNDRFRIFPSLRFEYFLVLLKYADFIIGNSSAGIRESGIYGVPAIDIGTRQNGRYETGIITNIQHTQYDTEDILNAINSVDRYRTEAMIFGDGNSTDRFLAVISDSRFWNISIQKRFIDRR